MEIGDTVKVKKTGGRGIIKIIEGIPPRKVYVKLFIGDIIEGGYVYFRMFNSFGTKTLTLNPYDINDIEVV